MPHGYLGEDTYLEGEQVPQNRVSLRETVLQRMPELRGTCSVLSPQSHGEDATHCSQTTSCFQLPNHTAEEKKNSDFFPLSSVYGLSTNLTFW